MASVRATACLLLLPPVSVLVVCVAVLWLCRVAARKLTALARAHCPPLSSRYLKEEHHHHAIRGLPVARYRRKQQEQEEEECCCVFCLSGIEEGEEIRELKCRHLFHRACLDRWLLATRPATCPLCRGRLLAPSPAVSAVWAPPWELMTGDGDGEEEEEEDSDMMLFMACVHGRSSWLWPS